MSAYLDFVNKDIGIVNQNELFKCVKYRYHDQALLNKTFS